MEQLTPDESGLITIEVGDRLKVVVKTLNGAELRRADLMSRGSDNDRVMCRAAYAVRSINGEQFGVPRNDGDLDRVMTRFVGAEWDAFTIIYSNATQDEALEEQIKKLLEPKLPEPPAQ